MVITRACDVINNIINCTKQIGVDIEDIRYQLDLPRNIINRLISR